MSTEDNNWDKSLEPLIKLLTHKKGVQTRQAAEVGKKVVTIFRGKEFMEYMTLQSNFTLIQRRCSDALSRVGAKDSINPEQAAALGELLVKNGFVARSVAKVVKIGKGGDESPEQVVKRKKWPEKVIRLPLTEQEFEQTSLYIILYEGSKTIQHALSFLAIIGVLVACMFPAWPVWAKIGVWYIVFWLSTSMLLILVVRMILYVCLWTVGIDFWWFPNILDEYAGIVDSFRPFYSIEKRNDGYGMMVIRFVSMGVIGVATWEFFQHNSWDDIKNFAQNGINDILDWGTDKLTALPQPKNNYLSIADIEKMTDETVTTATTAPMPEIYEEDLFDDMQEF